MEPIWIFELIIILILGVVIYRRDEKIERLKIEIPAEIRAKQERKFKARVARKEMIRIFEMIDFQNCSERVQLICGGYLNFCKENKLFAMTDLFYITFVELRNYAFENPEKFTSEAIDKIKLIQSHFDKKFTEE